MKTANVAEFKKHFSSYLELVEAGESVEICRRNIPVARLTGIPRGRTNRTVLGCGEGTVTYLADVTEPMISSQNWEMLDAEGAVTDGAAHGRPA